MNIFIYLCTTCIPYYHALPATTAYYPCDELTKALVDTRQYNQDYGEGLGGPRPPQNGIYLHIKHITTLIIVICNTN